MRLLSEPTNRVTLVAHEELTYGQAVYINTDKEWQKITASAAAANAVYFVVRPPEFSDSKTGYTNVVAAGELVEGVNGCKARFFSESMVMADLSTTNVGTLIGISEAGKLAASGGSAISSTVGYARTISAYTGDTSSGWVDVNIKAMV